MVETQKWLEENYPDKEKWIGEIYINQQLEGILDCSGYNNLYSISISHQVDSSKFEIKKGSHYGEETKIIHYIQAQEWLDQNYPKDGTCLRENEKSGYNDADYDINNYGKTRTQITKLNIWEQKLEGELDLSGFTNLELLDCGGNKLTSLNISDCDKLKILDYSYNHLTQIPYLSNPEQLTKLDITINNFPPQDLSIFSQFRNLEELKIGDNPFSGSLEPLKDLTKLKKLDIFDTNIDRGLEFLPRSVNYLGCSSDRSNARVSDIYEELQPFGFDGYLGGSNLNKWREVKLDKKLPLTISPLLPPQLINKVKKGNKFRENYGIPNTNYKKIHFNQWGENKPLFTKELPTKLYNIQTRGVEETKDTNIKNYAIISYVWGKQDENSVWNNTQYKDKELSIKKLNVSGNKALHKSIEASEANLNINYLWIDQLCINQDNPTEKSQEVSKMRQYYTNATVTLISINTELGDISNVDLIDILKAIVRSEWFTRSWTYQEGWLSKQTIFMFDDKLIDGRAMAGTWALNQISYVDGGKYESRSQFQKGTKKIATPVGWTYYRDGYTEEDKVIMTLSQALKGIKSRGRSVPIDGVYSILGLLPYGSDEKIIIDYENNTPEKALINVMEVAKENKYAEPIAWHGTSNTTPDLCWMPEVYEDGSTSVEGGIEIKLQNTYFEKEEESITLGSVSVYTIIETNSNLNKIEGGFEIESGLYQKVVKVNGKDENGKEIGEIIEVPLLGTQETLNSAEVGKELVVFNKTYWQSNKPFALLVERTNNGIYHRLGLVELGNEKLQKECDEIITIGNNSQELQAQIETPPK